MTASTPRVAIVGTGVIGAMAAWQLAGRGARVLAFDAYGRGHDRGASAGESRIFRTVYKEGASYVPLLLEARELWRTLEAESGRALLTLCGGLTIGAPDEPDLKAVRHCAEEAGLPHEILDREQTAARFPQHRLDEGEIALHDPGAGVLRPEPSVQSALEAAERHGARILSYRPVDDLTETAHGWRIASGEETWDVDHVVLTPGPWAARLAPLAGLPVRAKRITACWFAAREVAAHQPDRLPIAIRRHPEAGFSCFPVLDGVAVKIVPHHLGWPDIEGPDDLPRGADPAFARAASAAVGRLLPGLVPDPVRIGTYAEGFTPDGHPVVGPLPGAARATVLTGFSGHGFKLAPVFGRIAADLVLTGGTGHDLSGLSPHRFAHR
ncbi:N-methyl-L-tryptophan oxidase [Streptomyces albus subsp. chlorinus]|uniref:N-methyl-L-tryptophan oxidase n=1 Tax=Streptomyces albus TaxID=1888 RepID=UPI00156E437B|nr:N-methyl-L-tryptophan oxidase [Streptomyces albus]NSC20244.1 N-methyl-L-tryptophan oxidase [Streptomyces albus subsp. chlorinus]